MSKSLCIIILAAGNSSRFGSNKLLHLINNRPMYTHSIALAKTLQPDCIIAVTKYPKIIHQLKQESSVHVVENCAAHLGQAHSMKLGILASQKFSPNFSAYLFMVSDQPYLKSQSLQKLWQTWQQTGGICALSHNNKRGNPIIFAAQYLPELLTVQGDTGGRTILQQHLAELTLVEVTDAKELSDIDTPQDIKQH